MFALSVSPTPCVRLDGCMNFLFSDTARAVKWPKVRGLLTTITIRTKQKKCCRRRGQEEGLCEPFLSGCNEQSKPPIVHSVQIQINIGFISGARCKCCVHELRGELTRYAVTVVSKRVIWRPLAIHTRDTPPMSQSVSSVYKHLGRPPNSQNSSSLQSDQCSKSLFGFELPKRK